ncbi:MAG: hypothetical protein EBX22_02195 [Candidatus Fonsibacter ubiquis]|nr:hypothetical protein [Candidatus Fonsibacter ubiquis]
MDPTGPVSDQAKYEVSKNALKNGFSSKRFIIYGENKKEYEQYRDGLLSELKPINSIHVDICFQIIMTGWNIKRLNNSRNGVYNLETKQTLENSFNIENIYSKSDKHIKKYLNHHNKNSEVFGLIFARDCAGSKVIEHITELEQKMMARYHKILNQYLADRFGKETVNE